MKLYILCNDVDKNIIAISEIKKYIYQYIVQNNYSNSYKVNKIGDERLINKFLLMYDELYLDMIEGIVLTLSERRIIFNSINESKSQIENCIIELTNILNDYSFSTKNSICINKTIRILINSIKPKKINTIFNIKEQLLRLFNYKRNNVSNLFEEYNELRDRYLIKINLK